MNNQNVNMNVGPVYMPDGTAAPPLLTEQEAIRLLRLDQAGLANPSETLKYYRTKGQLRATRVGGHRYCYQLKELLSFLDKATDWTNRNKND